MVIMILLQSNVPISELWTKTSLTLNFAVSHVYVPRNDNLERFNFIDINYDTVEIL